MTVGRTTRAGASAADAAEDAGPRGRSHSSLSLAPQQLQSSVGADRLGVGVGIGALQRGGQAGLERWGRDGLGHRLTSAFGPELRREPSSPRTVLGRCEGEEFAPRLRDRVQVRLDGGAVIPRPGEGKVGPHDVGGYAHRPRLGGKRCGRSRLRLLSGRRAVRGQRDEDHHQPDQAREEHDDHGRQYAPSRARKCASPAGLTL